MIIRGTTPTMTFGLPFKADVIETGFVIVRQNETAIIEKPLSDCDCNETSLSAKFTQEETLRLSAARNAEIRIVLKTLGGERHESKPICERVEDTSKDGVI